MRNCVWGGTEVTSLIAAMRELEDGQERVQPGEHREADTMVPYGTRTMLRLWRPMR
jgi:hypothetical protein